MAKNSIYTSFYSRFACWFASKWYIRGFERRRILSYLKKRKPKKVLDFGCNRGWFASIVKKKLGADVYGTDINKVALKQGRERYPDIKFITINHAKKMKGKFDAIIISHVLEHVPDCLDTLSLLRTLLSPDGRLVVAVPQERIKGDCNLPHIFICSIQNRKFTNPHLHMIKRDNLSKMLKKTGMSLEQHNYVNLLPPFVTSKYLWPIAASMVAFCKPV